MARPSPALLLPLAIVGLAVGIDLALVLAMPEGVFFLGDGGLKYLATLQMAGGDLALDLHPPVAPWVADLWSQGLYPFDFPFVFPQDGLHWLAFPPWFHLLSAPFLRLFGYYGLYAIPLAAAAWAGIEVARCLRRLGAGTGVTVAGTATLMVATPFLLYGAMFWEHTLACALVAAAAGRTLSDPRPAAGRAVARGVMMGLAGWLRPECIVLGGLFATGLFLPGLRPEPEGPATHPDAGTGDHASTRRPPLHAAVAFAAGLLVTLLGFVAANLATSGHPLGFHSTQVTGADSGWRLRMIAEVLAAQIPLYAAYAPVAVALALAVLANLAGRLPVARSGFRLPAVVALVAPFAVSLIAPNDGGKQWGPRYLLCVLPLVAVGTGLLLDGWKARAPFPRAVLAVLVGGTLLAGGIWNAGFGTRHVADDYRERVAPVLEFVRDAPGRLVVVDHQWIAQDLAVLFARKGVVRMATTRQLEPVVRALREQGETRFQIVLHRIRQDRTHWSSSLPDGGRLECEQAVTGPTFAAFDCTLS